MKEYCYRGGELLVTMSSGDDRRLRRFVYNLYYIYLRRAPGRPGLAGWAGAAAGGATKRSNVCDAFPGLEVW